MNKRTARKSVDAQHGLARLAKARGYREQAHTLVILMRDGTDGSSAVSLMVSAVIAYADALTAIKAGVVNQQDHARVVDLVRDVMGNAFPRVHEHGLRKLLSRKDEAQYGTRTVPAGVARDLLVLLDAFGDWVESLL